MSKTLFIDLPPKGDELELPLVVTERIADAALRDGVDSRREALTLVDQLATRVESWPQFFREFFQDCARGLEPEQSAELHQLRETLRARWEAVLAQSRRLLALAEQFHGLPEATKISLRLRQAQQNLAKLGNDVFDRWHTLEDLESLLVKYFPLTTAQLEALAAKFRPPPEWFADDDKPF
jgi:hypothetical protein